jgi:hypothetical protein
MHRLNKRGGLVIEPYKMERKGQRGKNGRERNDEYGLLSSLSMSNYTQYHIPSFLSFHTISKLCVLVCGTGVVLRERNGRKEKKWTD